MSNLYFKPGLGQLILADEGTFLLMEDDMMFAITNNTELYTLIEQDNLITNLDSKTIEQE